MGLSGQGIVSFLSSVQLPADAQKIITDVFALKFTDNNNPNTKLTTNFTDSIVPESLAPSRPANGASVVPTVQIINMPDKTGPSRGGDPGKGLDHIPGPPDVRTFNGAFTERVGATTVPRSIRFPTRSALSTSTPAIFRPRAPNSVRSPTRMRTTTTSRRRWRSSWPRSWRSKYRFKSAADRESGVAPP
jgi:hypothetical protein